MVYEKSFNFPIVLQLKNEKTLVEKFFFAGENEGRKESYQKSLSVEFKSHLSGCWASRKPDPPVSWLHRRFALSDQQNGAASGSVPLLPSARRSRHCVPDTESMSFRSQPDINSQHVIRDP